MTEIEKPFITKQVSSLLYNRLPALVDAVKYRQIEVTNPKGKTSGYVAGDSIELEIGHDQFEDLATSCLFFDMAIATGTTPYIANAADIIQRVEIKYNDVVIESFDHANYWCNAFLAYTANKSWVETEGTAMLGLGNQIVESKSGARTRDNGTSVHMNYCVPLALIIPFFRNHYFLPLLSNRLKISFLLAPNLEVVSCATDYQGVYTLNNVYLIHDMIVVNDKYRDKVREAMQGLGIRIPFTSYDTHTLTLTGDTTNNLVLYHNLSNAISLHMLEDSGSTEKKFVTTLYAQACQAFPCSEFSSLTVNSGSRYFTPQAGLRSFQELYRSAELCVNGMNELQGSGFIDLEIMKQGYTAHTSPLATSSSTGKYGLCLMSVNLEKQIGSDDNVINEGLNAHDGHQQFDIKLVTHTAVALTDKLQCNIVCKKVLTLSSGGIILDS